MVWFGAAVVSTISAVAVVLDSVFATGLLSPAVAAVGVPEHAQFGTCVWNMRALLVCDERWTGAYLGAATCSEFDPRDFVFFMGAINGLVQRQTGQAGTA